MDKAERTRFKTLANDVIIATFGSNSREWQLAVALGQCVDELDDTNDKCETCSVCTNHGDHADEGIDVDVNEVLRIHGELRKRLQEFKDLHGKFDDADDATDIPDLVNELALQVEELESSVDELEAGVLP